MAGLGSKLGTLVLVAGVTAGAVVGVVVGAAVAGTHSTTTIIYKSAQPSSNLTSANQSYVPVSSAVEAVKRAGSAVVSISHQLPSTQDTFGDITPGGTAIGSGFIVDTQGDIVTNNHVIAGGNPHYTVTFADGQQEQATFVGGNATYDVAVIRVSGPVPGTVEWADSSLIQVGEPVVAIGDPLGQFPNSASSGIVSGLHRELAGTCVRRIVQTCPEDYIQTDASINHGNSGGPMLDMSGRVVGINTAIQRSTGETNSSNNLFQFGDPSDPNTTVAEGLGFAIPSDTAEPLAEHLIRHTPLPYLGVCYRSVTLYAETKGIPPGARVQSGCQGAAVRPGSPAASAGIRPGDVIVAVGNVRLTNGLTLIQAVLPQNGGDTVALKIWRPKKSGSEHGAYIQRSATLGST